MTGQMPLEKIDDFHILVVVTPHFNIAATMSFLDPFRAANYVEGKSFFHWSIVSERGGTCLASNGVTIDTGALTGIRGKAPELVMLSTSWTPESYSSAVLHANLWRFARSGSRVGALDTGAFILAEAGLLDGRQATVHYEHLDAFGERFPDIGVCDDLFVSDQGRITCSGGTAATDCALFLLSELRGKGLANAAAKYLFVQGVRTAGTRQVAGSAEPFGRRIPEKLFRAIDLMEKNLEEPLRISEVCRRANVSHRQLDRLFRRYVKAPPSSYYRDIRLDRARGLVTQTELPLSQVALASGFSSQVHFSRAYKTRFGISPRADRLEGRVPFEFRSWPMHRVPRGQSS